MANVIFEADAGNYTVPQALSRFVPNLVWNKVREAKHQLLYGGKGSGKTHLLKRLSWPAMQEQPDFLEGTEFTAFYCDMRELET